MRVFTILGFKLANYSDVDMPRAVTVTMLLSAESLLDAYTQAIGTTFFADCIECVGCENTDLMIDALFKPEREELCGPVEGWLWQVRFNPDMEPWHHLGGPGALRKAREDRTAAYLEAAAKLRAEHYDSEMLRAERAFGC